MHWVWCLFGIDSHAPFFRGELDRSMTTKTHCLLQLASTNGTQSNGGICLKKCRSTVSTRQAPFKSKMHTPPRPEVFS